MSSARIAFLAVACLLSISNAFALPNSRIWNGEDVSGYIYPWVGSLRLDNAHVCVCSLISTQYVLTAGHCVSQIGTTAVSPSRVTVRVGSLNQFAGGTIVGAKSIDIHPSFGNFLNDLACIQMSAVLQLNDKVRPIALAAKDSTIDEGTSVNTAGWGLLQTGATPYKLQHNQMAVMSAPECEHAAGFGYDSCLCLSHQVGEGICRGDDGAPVVSNDQLVGVISFAFGGCGTKYPDVASKVSYYNEWINAVMTPEE